MLRHNTLLKQECKKKGTKNMAIISMTVINGGPFNSTSVVETVNGFPRGDKAVDAAFLASMFSSFISDGVCPSSDSALRVQTSSDLSVCVSPGIIWAKGYMAKLDSPVTLDLSAGHNFTVFLRLNLSQGNWSLGVYMDDSGWIPVRTDVVHDMVLGIVTVPSDASEVTSSMISDKRSDASVCGFAGNVLAV